MNTKTSHSIGLSSVPAFGIVSGKIALTHIDCRRYVQIRGVYDWGDKNISQVSFEFPDSHIANKVRGDKETAVAICVKPDNTRVGKIVPAYLKMIA